MVKAESVQGHLDPVIQNFIDTKWPSKKEQGDNWKQVKETNMFGISIQLLCNEDLKTQADVILESIKDGLEATMERWPPTCRNLPQKIIVLHCSRENFYRRKPIDEPGQDGKLKYQLRYQTPTTSDRIAGIFICDDIFNNIKPYDLELARKQIGHEARHLVTTLLAEYPGNTRTFMDEGMAGWGEDDEAHSSLKNFLEANQSYKVLPPWLATHHSISADPIASDRTIPFSDNPIYLSCYSFVDFMRLKFIPEKIIAFYQLTAALEESNYPKNIPENFQSIFGEEINTFSREWIEYLGFTQQRLVTLDV